LLQVDIFCLFLHKLFINIIWLFTITQRSSYFFIISSVWSYVPWYSLNNSKIFHLQIMSPVNLIYRYTSIVDLLLIITRCMPRLILTLMTLICRSRVFCHWKWYKDHNIPNLWKYHGISVWRTLFLYDLIAYYNYSKIPTSCVNCVRVIFAVNY
jgi:hypothetical protein